jgi:hypothetical protein
MVAETIVAAVPDTGARVLSLKEVLVNAARWNADREADVAPICASSSRAAISKPISCRPWLGPCRSYRGR